DVSWLPAPLCPGPVGQPGDVFVVKFAGKVRHGVHPLVARKSLRGYAVQHDLDEISCIVAVQGGIALHGGGDVGNALAIDPVTARACRYVLQPANGQVRVVGWGDGAETMGDGAGVVGVGAW